MLASEFREQSFVLASNGRGADGNAEAMLEFLRREKVREIWVVKHPLMAGEPDTDLHSVEYFEHGVPKTKDSIRIPFRPPFTYALDFLLPLLPRRAVDWWVGFTNLNVLRGLAHKRVFGVKHIAYASVDYTPARFGSGAINRAFEWVDKRACLGSDELWPISLLSHEARLANLKIAPKGRLNVLPMGAWLDRTETVSPENFEKKRLVFLGGLIEKQGVQGVLQALTHLPDWSFDIIGRGDYEPALRALTNDLGLGSRVHFRGFIKSHEEVEHLLSEGTLAMACYIPEIASFSKFADPGKLKAYLAAGLPIVLTDVSPNAREVAEQGGGALTAYDPKSIARAVDSLAKDETTWRKNSEAAKRYIQEFDWNTIFGRAFQVKP